VSETPPLHLDKILRRPVTYAISDGFMDIESGLAFMLVGGLSWLGRSLPASPAYWAAAGVVSGSCVFWLSYPFERLRKVITYPRGGYVAFEPLFTARRRFLYKLILAVAIAVVVALNVKFEMERFGGFWTAAVFLGLATLGNPTKRWPLLLAALLCAGFGFLWYWDNVSYSSEFSGMFWLGVTWIVLGFWRLWKFCKANPRPQPDGI
jgi:hypothetical protein